MRVKATSGPIVHQQKESYEGWPASKDVTMEKKIVKGEASMGRTKWHEDKRARWFSGP